MTDQTETRAGESTADLTRQAVDVLTAIARQTRVRGAGTPAEATEPIDFADAIAGVLTTVAANLGSAGTLLAGRPGSWEADLVARLIDGTAGDSASDLLRWRTEPVRLYVDGETVLYDLEIGALYDKDLQEAFARADDEALTDEEREAYDRLADKIEDLWQQDVTAYNEAFRTTAERRLTELGGTCGVEIIPRPVAPDWDTARYELEDYARQTAPLPMTGSAPDFTGGSPADALRRAGLTYTARAEASR